MGELSKKFLEICENHRQKVASLEQETLTALAGIITVLESQPIGAVAHAAAPSAEPAAPRVQEVVPVAEIAVTSRSRIALIKADITKLPVDAIVNPASRSMTGGGGIEGAIFAAAGPGLVEECHALGGCERGEAKITRGHNLPAKFVIHTVGPVWKGGDAGEPEMLAACYRHSLSLAQENGLKSIAFPAISAGNFGYPLADATRVAVSESAAFLKSKPGLERVYLVGFNDEAIQAFSQAMLEVSAK